MRREGSRQEQAKRLGDMGTPERHRRNELEFVVGNGMKCARVRNPFPCYTYWRRGQITLIQYSAATQLYEYYIKGYCQCVNGSGNYEPKERIQGGKKSDLFINDKIIHSIKQYDKAFNALGSSLQDAIKKVVIEEQYISDFTKDMHWYPRKKYKERLKEGLDIIARIYGLTT